MPKSTLDVDPRPASAAGSRDEQLGQLGRAFRHAYQGLRSLRGRETHLVAGEIGHAKFELLLELWERGPLSASELATASGLSAATVSHMLHQLAECGHVERVRSLTDRRVVVTALSPKGRRRVQEQRALWRERWKTALTGVEADELQIASDVLERIASVFEDQTCLRRIDEKPDVRSP